MIWLMTARMLHLNIPYAWHRSQGVGTAVMRQLMDSPAAANLDVYLTTISRTIPFYQRAGFQKVDRRQIPR